MATAKGALSIGGSRTETLQTSGEQDTFTVALLAGYNYQFTLTPAASFTTGPGYLYETLIGPNGLTVSNSQLSAGSNTSKSISITPTAATAGTYTLSVADQYGTGAYILAATPQDDVGPTPGTLTVGGNTAGTLESAGDTDTFTVALFAGYNYQFTLTPAASFTTGPGYLYETLIGPNGLTVSDSQLSAGSNTSKSISITPTAATAGTYTLSVADQYGTGAYLVAVTPQDDVGPTPGTLTVGGNTAGTLESAGDTDTFTINLAAGYNYQFTLTPAASFTTGPGYLYETLIGPNGLTVSNSLLSAGSNTSKSFSITPTAATAGTYTLSVADQYGTGAYLVAVTPQDDDGAPPRPLTIGSNTSGVLESAGDTDTFTVGLVAGSNYHFTLTAAASFTTGSGYLAETIIGPNNVRVSGSQITAGSQSSKSIFISPAITGTYTLSISDPYGTGTYTIGAATINSGNVPGLSTPAAVYRFFDNTNGTHFFTADVGERNNIIANQASRYTQETNGFGDTTQSDPNETAVYRFFDTVYGTHFFTANADERNTIQATRPDLTFEPNSTFYEHATPQSGDAAVYRFFDTQFGTHFYTGDATEYAGLTTPGSANFRANLTYEGIGFYAPAGTFR